jgi:nucleotide-binding universal stress UspA family protein
MKFKRILVAMIHSPLASMVFDRALHLAHQEQAHLLLLHCLAESIGFDPLLESGGALDIYPQIVQDETLPEKLQQAEDWLKAMAQEAVALDIPTAYERHFGEAGATICDVAQQWNADLIVLGRQDDSVIVEFFTGSVSNHVVHHAPCSVLVIKDGIDKPIANSPLVVEQPQTNIQQAEMIGMAT